MKTDQSRVASRYAEASIELALQSGGSMADEILSDLKAINAVFAGVPDFAVILNHPSIAAADKKQLLLGLFDGKLQELTLRLIGLLADKRRLDLMPEIEQEYLALLKSRQQIVTASLVSAEPLDEAQVAGVKKKLAEKIGRQLELDLSVDKTLIGGLVLRIGDEVIDGSLKGKLQSLEKALLSV